MKIRKPIVNMPPSRPGRRGERGRRVKKEEEGDPSLSFSPAPLRIRLRIYTTIDEIVVAETKQPPFIRLWNSEYSLYGYNVYILLA